ncbi:MAG TPA: DNA internalization-related competence protein ComEC/Rec2 [Candidatus Acidoferrales bacterium]|nr:DNA internalization-related competence protein ComEC/Rec2 [Candidatus Acidoferrales bacterium]
MKLPAVAMAAAFLCGIVLGLCPPVSVYATSRSFLVAGFLIAGSFVFTGILLTVVGRMVLAATSSLFAWMFLGLVGVCVAEQPRPADHILSLVTAGRIDLHSPLRWQGTLRDEPARLPWGIGYEIELAGVEYQNQLVPGVGGMRLSFSPHPDDSALPELHAGDAITVVALAKQPQVFRDEGAFDRRAYLASHNIDLVADLRAPDLIARTAAARTSMNTAIARARRRLRDEVDVLFTNRPEVAGVLRAMLLGDRSFVDREEALDFQRTGVFHVLVVAGLHVGALAFFLYWLGRRLRLSRSWMICFTLTLLFAYVAVIEQRPPVLRATLMATVVVLGGFFYRRLDLFNSAAIAALVLLIVRPLAVKDSSFQLTFLAIVSIAGVALPWLEKTVQPYGRALRGWRDVTRDAAHEPRAAQFRIDLRAMANWISAWLPPRLAAPSDFLLVRGIAFSFRIWELLVLTMVLQIGMLPLMARDFHRITLTAPLANLVAVPLTGVVVPFGFLTLGSAIISPAFARVLAAPLSWITLLLLRLVQWFAHFPSGSYRIPGAPLWVMTSFFAFAALLVLTMRLTHRWEPIRFALGSGLLACSALIALFPFAPVRSAGKLEVTVLDVGQGDSLFVVSPRGKTLLIDGGGAFGGFGGRNLQKGNAIDPGEEAVSPYLWSRGYRRLDVVALTHAHQDHLGGLTAILENFRVGQLWIGREVASQSLARLEHLAAERNIRVEHEARGQGFAWDGVEGEIFWPEISSAQAPPAAKNDDSLVLRLHYKDRTILLPGDAEKEAEREMLAENDGSRLRADVLKVGHHGSKNSTTEDFLAAVRPQVAIISAGEDNPYGHPSPEMLQRLETSGVRVLRTDRDGAIHVLTDGHALEINCFAGCPFPSGDALRQAQAPDHDKNNQHQ